MWGRGGRLRLVRSPDARWAAGLPPLQRLANLPQQGLQVLWGYWRLWSGECGLVWREALVPFCLGRLTRLQDGIDRLYESQPGVFFESDSRPPGLLAHRPANVGQKSVHHSYQP